MAGTPDAPSDDRLQLLAEELVLALPAVEEVLSGVAVAAAQEAEHSCGITYRSLYGALTVASSDELANAVDELQYGTGDGPCLEAMRRGAPVRVDDVAIETRWGSYPSLAAKAGVASSLSYPLLLEDRSIGALNLYSTRRWLWTAEREAQVAALSRQVSGVLSTVQRMAGELAADPTASRAFSARHDLDIATGVLMAREGCSGPDARALIEQDAARRGVSTAVVVTELLRPN